MLKTENIKLNKNYIWDTVDIDRKEVTVTSNDNKINLPRVRCLMKREPLLFHLMLKQGITWFTLVAGMQETV